MNLFAVLIKYVHVFITRRLFCCCITLYLLLTVTRLRLSWPRRVSSGLLQACCSASWSFVLLLVVVLLQVSVQNMFHLMIQKCPIQLVLWWKLFNPMQYYFFPRCCTITEGLQRKLCFFCFCWSFFLCLYNVVEVLFTLVKMCWKKQNKTHFYHNVSHSLLCFV